MKDYHSTLGVAFEPFSHTSFTSVPVLTFLTGRKWDELALGVIQGLRPSSVRVTTGELKSNADLHRVTVYVDSNDIILGITQEMQIGLPDGIENGHEFSIALDIPDVEFP